MRFSDGIVYLRSCFTRPVGQGGFLFAERGKLHAPTFFKNQFDPALQVQN